MKIKRSYVAAAALLLIFPACKMMGPESGTGSGQGGKAAVRIGVEGTGLQGRTVLPAAALADVTEWELWGGKPPENETLLEAFSGTSATVYLETGSWNFTLKGYKGNEDLILQGNITSKTITLEGTNDLAFTVAPLLEGQGIFSITVDLPSGHGITGAEVWKDGDKITDPAPVLNGDTVTFEHTYTAGDYYFSVRLYKGPDLYGVVSELAQVRGNLRSEKSYTLSLDDLSRTYIITYHLNGGQFDAGAGNPGYYWTNDDFTLPIPAQADYFFEGWHDDSGFTGIPVTLVPQGSTGDKGFYAKWIAIPPGSHTVIFKKNDGTETNHAVKFVLSPATDIGAGDFPADPFRGDSIFAGWNTQADGGGSSFTASTTVSGDITVYAHWISGAIIVLKVDAGAGAFSQTDFTLPSGGSQTVTITGSGYTGPRWFVDGEFKGTGTSITINAADYGAGGHTLSLMVSRGGVSWSKELKFTVNTAMPRRVIFSANDGTGAIYAVKTVAEDGPLGTNFPAPNPTRTGYDFTGWNAQADGGGGDFTASTTVSADTTVYAQWTAHIYTVTFDKNSGETEADPTTKTVTFPAAYINALPAPPARTNYNFAGWNTKADGSGAAFTASTPVTANITVYALWAHGEFTISLNLDAGAGAFSQATFIIASGGSKTVSISGSGYTGPRWFVDGEFKGTGTGITINAADYGAGGHTLALIISKGGVAWSKELKFTVTP